MRSVYFDHSATTPVDKRVAAEMINCITGNFGNPSSIHAFGRRARMAVEEARERVAKGIGANPDEIVFTSGGTEADNIALEGAARANRERGNHIITCAVEHHAVLDICKTLEKDGFKITVLPVDACGMVHVEDVAGAVSEKTILITIMHANNEVGTIQPIPEIGRLARERGIIFHTDAVQSAGKIPVRVDELGVDLLSLSGHKIYGPKGIGALYIRSGTRWQPVSHGGGQERGQRAGTENVPGIVALGKAVELAAAELDEEAARLTRLRDKLIQQVTERISHVYLNGHPVNRVPNNINFSFQDVEGESLLLSLDREGIAASSGSACAAGAVEPSHVLTAMGVPPALAQSSLRITLGRENTEDDVDYLLAVLPPVIERLRSMAPKS